MFSHRSFTPGILAALLGCAVLAVAAIGGMRLLAQSGTAGGNLDKPAVRRPEPSKSGPASPEAKTEKQSTGNAPAKPDRKPASANAKNDPERKLTPVDAEAIAEAKAAETERLNALFPVGRVFQDVKMPSYSGDTLTSVIHADFMRRADGEHLEMEMLEIVNYNAGEPDSRILTDRAIYDMEAKTMRSTTPAKIVHPQFEMRGDRLIFDSQTRMGHMIGNVKTRIEQADQFVHSEK